MDGNNVNRVRINATQDAKGRYKLEATAEFETPGAAATNLAEALRSAESALAAEGYVLLRADKNKKE
jgi:hypothetical protein